jgi:hypothetical protein
MDHAACDSKMESLSKEIEILKGQSQTLSEKNLTLEAQLKYWKREAELLKLEIDLVFQRQGKIRVEKRDLQEELDRMKMQEMTKEDVPKGIIKCYMALELLINLAPNLFSDLKTFLIKNETGISFSKCRSKSPCYLSSKGSKPKSHHFTLGTKQTDDFSRVCQTIDSITAVQESHGP